MKIGRGAKVTGWSVGLVGLAAGLATAACGTAGDRASSGACPDGEVCSDATPAGLRFYGAGLAGSLENGTTAMVVGGRQTIRWQDARGGAVALPQHTLRAVDEDIILVESARLGSASLVAAGEGSTQLRVEDVEGFLMDRVSIAARPVARASVIALDAGFADALTSTPREPSFAAGTHALGVALHSSAGADSWTKASRSRPRRRSSVRDGTAWI